MQREGLPEGVMGYVSTLESLGENEEEATLLLAHAYVRYCESGSFSFHSFFSPRRFPSTPILVLLRSARSSALTFSPSPLSSPSALHPLPLPTSSSPLLSPPPVLYHTQWAIFPSDYPWRAPFARPTRSLSQAKAPLSTCSPSIQVAVLLHLLEGEGWPHLTSGFERDEAD